MREVGAGKEQIVLVRLFFRRGSCLCEELWKGDCAWHGPGMLSGAYPR
jgi:hypothetical protein